MSQQQHPHSGGGEPQRSRLSFRAAEKKWAKIVGLGALTVALITGCSSAAGDDASQATATPTVTVTATVTATPAPMTSQVSNTLAEAADAAKKHGYRVSSHDASEKDASPAGDWKVCFEKVTYDSVAFGAVTAGAPCPKTDGRPIPWPSMPTAVGRTYAHAVDAIGKVTAGEITVRSSYKDEDVDADYASDGDYDDWKVCFQSPVPGTRVVGDRDVTLWLTEDSCPATKGTYKDKTNDPNYTPPSSTGSSASGSGSAGTGGAGTSCEIVSNAGNCYNAGQFCRGSDVGASTHAANGRLIYCRDEGSVNRWNY